MRGGIAVDVEAIPLFGMADIVDAGIVVLAPEKRHRGKALPLPDDVPRGDHTLVLRNHPMLDADLLARSAVRPARDVAGGVDTGSAGLQEGVDGHAAKRRRA